MVKKLIVYASVMLIFATVSYTKTTDIYEEALYQCMDMREHSWSSCKGNVEFKIKANVTGSSMMPFIDGNKKLTWCVPQGKNDVKIGDILLICDGFNCIGHTLIEIRGDRYITKGYNLMHEDVQMWKYEQIKAKLWKVEG